MPYSHFLCLKHLPLWWPGVVPAARVPAWVVTLALAVAPAASLLHLPQAMAQPMQALRQTTGPLLLAGQGQMRFLGLRIYDARLWVGSEFEVQRFEAHPLALELTYHRAFSAQAIAERSVQEMAHQRALTPEQIARWTAQLAQWLPDVQAGDQLTGVHLPGQGMQLWQGGQPLQTLADAELARYFFGIWLSPQTSQPQLRSALLAGLPRGAP